MYFWSGWGCRKGSWVVGCLFLFSNRSLAMQPRLASNLSSSCLSLRNAGQIVGFPHSLNEWPFLCPTTDVCLDTSPESSEVCKVVTGRQWPGPGSNLSRQEVPFFPKAVLDGAAHSHQQPVPASAVRTPSGVPTATTHLLLWKLKKKKKSDSLLPLNRSLLCSRKFISEARKEKKIHTFPTLPLAPIKRAL